MKVNAIDIKIYIPPTHKNGGIVPPWLQDKDVPHIMGITGNRNTCFVKCCETLTVNDSL